MFNSTNLKKFVKIMTFLMIFIFSFNFSFSTCSVSNLGSECKVVDSSYLYLNLDGLNDEDILDFGGKLCYKDYSDICVDLVKDGNSLKNKIPLSLGGIYKADVWIKDKYSNLISKSLEIFVENKFLPPLIISDINLNDTQNNIFGKCISGFKIVGENKFTGDKNFEVLCEGGSFLKEFSSNDLIVETFYYKNNDKKISSEVDRVIYPSNFEENYNLVDNLNLGDLVLFNKNNLFNLDNNLISISRDLIIGGTSTNSNGVIFINGKKAFLVNGKFYSQIQLNEGKNEIEILNSNGDILISKEIYYIKKGKFAFTNLKIPKIINKNSIDISGSVNYDSMFNVYVNGDYYSTIKTKNNEFDFKINNLNEKRNFITFKSKSGVWNWVIYVDNESPQFSVLGPESQNNPYMFNFKISDDLGINYSSISIKLGEKLFNGDLINIFGDYYSIDVSDFSAGTYTGEITLEDIAGNKLTKSFNLKISSDETLIENLVFENSNSKFVGRVLFLDKKDNQKLILVPSRYIAFKSIYLDGKRIDNYEIKKNGEVYINLNLSDINENGKLELNFINQDYNEFKETFTYFSKNIEESPIKLNYISWNNDGGKLKLVIYGKVNSKIFDWNFLKEINNLDYKRIGDYIEIYVSIEDLNNLDLFTYDIFGNQLKRFIFDVSKNENSKIKILADPNNGFGSIVAFENYDKNLGIKSNIDKFYDDFSFRFFNNLYLSQIDDSGYLVYDVDYGSFNNFNNNIYGYLKSDITIPKLYVEKNGSENKIYVDGTFSNVDIINLTLGNEIVDNYVDCGYFKKYGKCIKFNNPDDKLININVRDESGLELSKVLDPLNSNFDINKYKNQLNKIYFVGNDYYLSKKPLYLRGKYISSENLESITIDSKACEFDEINFICEVDNLEDGLNNLEVSLNVKNKKLENDSYEVDYKSKGNFSIIDLSLKGNKIILTNNGYYVVGNLAYFNVDYKNEGLYEIFIGGEKVDSGEVRNKIDIDFTSQVLNKNEDNFDLEFVAYDKNTGDKKFSEKFEIFYTRVINTLVKVLLE
jgi:hypothetical protein